MSRSWTSSSLSTFSCTNLPGTECRLLSMQGELACNTYRAVRGPCSCQCVRRGTCYAHSAALRRCCAVLSRQTLGASGGPNSLVCGPPSRTGFAISYLCVANGWGIRARRAGNAISLAASTCRGAVAPCNARCARCHAWHLLVLALGTLQARSLVAKALSKLGRAVRTRHAHRS